MHYTCLVLYRAGRSRPGHWFVQIRSGWGGGLGSCPGFINPSLTQNRINRLLKMDTWMNVGSFWVFVKKRKTTFVCLFWRVLLIPIPNSYSSKTNSSTFYSTSCGVLLFNTTVCYAQLFGMWLTFMQSLVIRTTDECGSKRLSERVRQISHCACSCKRSNAYGRWLCLRI